MLLRVDFGSVGMMWLAAIGQAVGGVLNHTFCQSASVTVPLQNDTRTHEAYGFLVSDPVPHGTDVTCNTRLLFNSTVQLRVRLTQVLVWNKTQGAERDGYGWRVATNDGIKQLVWTQIKDKSWKNYSSDSCPYMHVKDDSQVAVQLRVNVSQEFLTRLLEIFLLEVPDSAWCDVTVQYTASEPAKERCQTAGGFYCNLSASCVVPSQRCNGLPDCSNGEDEEDCSYEMKPDAFALASAPGVVSAVSVAVVAVIATVVIVAVLCRRQSLSKRSRRGKPENSSTSVSLKVNHIRREEPTRSLEERQQVATNADADAASDRLYATVDDTYEYAQPHSILIFNQPPADVRMTNYYEHLQDVVCEHPYERSMISNHVLNKVV